MVEEVKAWMDATGTVHKSKVAALEADAIAQLKKLQVFNHASAMAVCQHAEAVVEALGPLVEERRPGELED